MTIEKSKSIISEDSDRPPFGLLIMFSLMKRLTALNFKWMIQRRRWTNSVCELLSFFVCHYQLSSSKCGPPKFLMRFARVFTVSPRFSISFPWSTFRTTTVFQWATVVCSAIKSIGVAHCLPSASTPLWTMIVSFPRPHIFLHIERFARNRCLVKLPSKGGSANPVEHWTVVPKFHPQLPTPPPLSQSTVNLQLPANCRAPTSSIRTSMQTIHPPPPSTLGPKEGLPI